MRKAIVIIVLLSVAGVGAWYYRSNGQNGAGTTPTDPAAGGGGPGGGRGGRGGGPRAPMTVDTANPSRHDIVEYVTVVGNLIGAASVDVVPRVAGRLEAINVKLGDRVAKGQSVAKIEDRAIREQLKQREANLDVNKANVIQRDNDAKAAQAVLERTKTSFERGIAARQSLEDAELKYNSALSQVSVARAQVVQTQAQIDELKITLGDTNVVSPVDGFVGRRVLDQGAFAGANTVILSVVDISTVRMVANVVEKDFKRVQPGVEARVSVDVFPGEKFSGEVSRVAPIFDPATRTAAIEIEVPNPGFRLKPGMYARVELTVDRRKGVLAVPLGAVIDAEGKRGVYVTDGQTARLREVHTGLQDEQRVEILDGVSETDRVITVGALALRDGDRVTLIGGAPGTGGGRAGRGGREGEGRRGGGEQATGRQ
jgi:RND family efflux transporter MFP subunit